MAETFEKILVKDDRLGCITPKVKFQVLKGGQNITCQPFKAISETKASHVYNVTVPSLETIISREVLWQSTVTLKITTTGKAAADFAVNYGVTDALAPFPLHSLVTTMTATINNNTISQNMMDTLPILLRMVDSEEFAKYDCMTPTALDYLAEYKDGVHRMDFQLDQNSQGQPCAYMRDATDSQPPASGTLTGTKSTAFVSYPNNSLAFDMNRPAATAYYHKPRGAWKLEALYAVDASTNAQRVPRVTDTVVYARFKVTEPLLLSPFVFGSGYGKQGFYGIQTMNFNMNINSNAGRAWRSAVFEGTKTVEVEKFADSQLLFQFLTPHASDMLDPRNVVPFYEFPVYRTSNNVALQPRPNYGRAISTGVIEDAPTVTIASHNIQLSGIPDKLIIFVRKRVADLGCKDTDSYATIKGISINFNNQAGLLSSMTQEQLFRNSIQSGLANMSWDEFCGSTVSAASGSTNVGLREPYLGLGARDASPGFQMSPTTGTILVLNFAEVIQLTEEYYAPGSLGSFNLQLTVQVQNNQYEAWPENSYELVIIPMNTGVFVNERGTSSTFLSLLTKQDVLDALQQQPYSNFEMRRMVGGGFLDGLKSAVGWVKGKLPGLRSALEMVPNQYAQTGASVLKTLGYGQGHKSIDNRLA